MCINTEKSNSVYDCDVKYIPKRVLLYKRTVLCGGGVFLPGPFTDSKVGGGLNVVFGPLQVHYRFYSFKIEMYIKQ